MPQALKKQPPHVAADKAFANFEKLRLELETIRKRFVRYLIRMAVARAEAEAQQVVESQIVNTEHLTDAQLLWLKRSIRDLPKSHRKEIETTCSNPQVWWHLRSEDGLKGMNSFHINRHEGRPDQIGEYTAEGAFFQMTAMVLQLHRSFLYKLGYRLDPYRAPALWPKLAVTIAALYDKTQRKAAYQFGVYHRHRVEARQRAVQKRWRSIKA